VKDFKELRVWQRAHEINLEIYAVTRHFPSDERFGLTSQLRRAAASIGANVAEGCGRRSDGELTRFLQIARGSASELEYHLILARDLHMLSRKNFEELLPGVEEVQRMLTALVQRVRPVSEEPKRHRFASG